MTNNLFRRGNIVDEAPITNTNLRSKKNNESPNIHDKLNSYMTFYGYAPKRRVTNLAPAWKILREI